jgi:sporulation protein YlmC with PRC-barrel domain
MKYALATTSVIALLMAGPAMAQTTGNQNKTTGNPAQTTGQAQTGDQAQTGNTGNTGGQPAAGADINVKQPAPVVTVDPKAPNITVTTEKPDIKVVQPPPKVIVTDPKPEVKVRAADPNVKVLPSGEPDVTVVNPPAGGVGSTAPAAPAAAEPVAPAAEVFPLAADMETLIGKDVFGEGGEEVGEIENLLIGPDGRVRAAIIEFGGFLGIGENEVAVPWDRLNVAGQRVTVEMTEADIRAAPRWSLDRPGEFAEYRPFR